MPSGSYSLRPTKKAPIRRISAQTRWAINCRHQATVVHYVRFSSSESCQYFPPPRLETGRPRRQRSLSSNRLNLPLKFLGRTSASECTPVLRWLPFHGSIVVTLSLPYPLFGGRTLFIRPPKTYFKFFELAYRRREILFLHLNLSDPRPSEQS